MRGDDPETLTGRQDAILRFLREFWDRHHYGPSVREIGQATGGLSTSVVLYHIERLEAQGLVQREARTARTLRLVEVRHE